MSGRQILSLVLAVIVGIVAVKLIIGLFSVVFTLVWWILGAALTVGVVYFLYRGFNNMLTSGKRLT
jgi:hypothetical protein